MAANPHAAEFCDLVAVLARDETRPDSTGRMRLYEPVAGYERLPCMVRRSNQMIPNPTDRGRVVLTNYRVAYLGDIDLTQKHLLRMLDPATGEPIVKFTDRNGTVHYRDLEVVGAPQPPQWDDPKVVEANEYAG